MRYLIASDIDKTLIKNYKTDISEKTKQIINKLKNNNNLFVIASGRPLENIKRLYGKNCDYIVGSNGAIIYDTKHQKIIYKNPIDKQTCKDIINTIGDNYEKYTICTKNGWNINTKNTYTPIYKEEKLIKNINEVINYEIYKIEIYYKNNQTLEEITNKLKKYKDIEVIKVQRSERGYIEISKKGTDKYNALKQIMKIENIDNNQLITFGDNLNDYNMIKNASIGVAVEDANQEILKIAKETTKPCQEDGVYYWLNNNFDLENNQIKKKNQ